MKNMMTVASFNELDKAEVLRRRLEQEGIPAEVYDEANVQKFWFLSKSLAGKKLRVEEKDFDRAMQLLNGIEDAEHPLKDAVRCPECGSSRVQYPQFTRKFAVPTLVEVFCVSPFCKKEFYCENCQCTWSPDPPTPEPDRDVLNWPIKDEERAG